MSATGEINALLELLDDPDEEVFFVVVNKLKEHGSAVLPRLESFWETTPDEELQRRIEILIHQLHFNDLRRDFIEWASQESPELLRGAILVARYYYPGLREPEILAQFDQFRRSVWLELNNYMSPLEQVHVFNTVLYQHYHLQGHELGEHNCKHFYINDLFESKQGNGFTIGVVYLSICELLDIPIFAVDIPRQFIFAYIDTVHQFAYPDKEGETQVQFYLDPATGILYSGKDVMAYLQKIGVTDMLCCYIPISSKRVIFRMMEELTLCFRYQKEDEKADELQQLLNELIAANKG